MDAAKGSNHLRSKTLLAKTSVEGHSLQSSPILRPLSSLGCYTPPRKASRAGMDVRERSPPPSPSPSTFRGVSAAREFQAAIRKDVLFLKQQCGSSSKDFPNMVHMRTRSTSNASSASSCTSSSSSSNRSDARVFVRQEGRPIGRDGKVIAPGVSFHRYSFLNC